MKRTHGGDVWRAGAPDKWLDFSANLAPEGPPDWALDALCEAMGAVQYYPDELGTLAARGLAAHLGVDERCVLATAGGAEAIALAGALAGGHVVTEPAFCEYAGAIGERPCVRVARAALDAFALPRGANVWLCNPCNPTGEAFSREKVLALWDRVRAAGGRLVVDEAFIDYCPEISVRDQAQGARSLIVLGSMTKALCVPGVRLGYLLSHPETLAQLKKERLSWTLNCFAAQLSARLPGHAAYFARIAAQNALRRDAFGAGLAQLGVKVYPSRANFLLVRLEKPAPTVAAALEEKGILVRPCEDFAGLNDGHHLRLAVRSEGENARMLAALAGIL